MKLMRWLLVALGIACAAPAFGQPAGVSQAQMFGCNREVTAGVVANSPIVVASGASRIYVCGFLFASAGTTPTMTLFFALTGTACAASLGTVVPVLSPISGTPIVDHQPFYAGLPPVPAGDDLCATVVGLASQLLVYYTQF